MVILYKCKLCNAEMISSAFELNTIYGGHVLSVKSTNGTKAALKFDFGDADDVCDEDEQINDIVDCFNYNPLTLTKAQFQTMIKGYMKSILEIIKKEKPDDEEYQKSFQKNCMDLIKKVLSDFGEYEFYMNSDNVSNGAFVFGYWENPETDKGPTFFYFVYALKQEKM